MRTYFSVLSAVMLAAFFLAGCGAAKEEAVKEYLIVDAASSKIINRYEYTEETNNLVRTVSYTDQERLDKNIEYEYDSKGFLVKTIEQVPGLPARTVTYDNKLEFDSSGKLIKMIRTSSDGEVVETNFGYDENGVLRGAVEKDSRGNLIMKDY